MLADTHGNVIVVGTRDCSLQRRFQKLVEEAPAPFLSDEQRATIHEAAKAICREAGYHGAGTVEFLVGQDGLISFLEVNTRLQVEHPVSEETSGLDLVREQFRIAERRAAAAAPTTRSRAGTRSSSGSTVKTPAAASCPPPGTVSAITLPGRAGRARRRRRGGGVRDRRAVRLAAGQADRHGLGPRPGSGAVAPRAGRVPGRGHGDGAAVPPAGGRRPGVRRVDEHFTVHTRWIETEWDNTVAPFDGGVEAEEAAPRQSVVVEVGGRRLEVSLPGDFALGGTPASSVPAVADHHAQAPREGRSRRPPATPSRRRCRAPSSRSRSATATRSSAGDLVVVLEAMKMENPVTAHKSGTVTSLAAEPGSSVSQGAVLCEIKD